MAENRVKAHGYRSLLVWQRSLDLIETCYQVSRRFPRDEIYGLTSQLRRAAVSVAANIAEGHGRRHSGDCLHHLSIANGSLREVETHVLIARRLGYMEADEEKTALDIASETARMLHGLFAALQRRPKPVAP